MLCACQMKVFVDNTPTTTKATVVVTDDQGTDMTDTEGSKVTIYEDSVIVTKPDGKPETKPNGVVVTEAPPTTTRTVPSNIQQGDGDVIVDDDPDENDHTARLGELLLRLLVASDRVSG